MTKRQLLFAQLTVLIVLLFVVNYGIEHMYLWNFAWFSALAHFLGGLWAVFFFAWGQNVLRLSRSFALCIAATLALGIFWEIFEVSIGATHFPLDSVDTIEDLCMDVVGGTIGASLMRYLWLRK